MNRRVLVIGATVCLALGCGLFGQSLEKRLISAEEATRKTALAEADKLDENSKKELLQKLSNTAMYGDERSKKYATEAIFALTMNPAMKNMAQALGQAVGTAIKEMGQTMGQAMGKGAQGMAKGLVPSATVQHQPTAPDVAAAEKQKREREQAAQERMQKILDACANEISLLCGGTSGFKAQLNCLRQHLDGLMSACRRELTNPE